MFFQLLSVCGAILGFMFLTLSVASGLYYLSELVEEYSEPTRRLLKKTIYTIIGLHILLLIDGFPVILTIFSIASNVVHYQNLKRFPFLSLSSSTFICTCILVALNHYFWLKYFNNVNMNSQVRLNSTHTHTRRASFAEVTSFFAICIWSVPFALFLSLSAGDNVLPTSIVKKENEYAAGVMGRKASSLVKVVIDSLRDYFRGIARVLGIWGHKRWEH